MVQSDYRLILFSHTHWDEKGILVLRDFVFHQLKDSDMDFHGFPLIAKLGFSRTANALSMDISRRGKKAGSLLYMSNDTVIIVVMTLNTLSNHSSVRPRCTSLGEY